MNKYTEFCNEQATKLFQIIDEHQGLLKWRKTWKVEGCMSLPRSVHGFYRGNNLWNLLIEQTFRGLVSNRWLTFNQVKKQDGHVLKGAKGTRVFFCKINEAESDDINDVEGQSSYPLFRSYTVFNLDQTSLARIDSILPTETNIQTLIDTLQINISEFGNRAFYNPIEDVIVMPRREYFDRPEDYDVTLLHEICHYTGHSSRLDRNCARDYMLSDAARAEEELVAEIGSVFLSGHFGIVGDLINHASYVTSWKKYLDSKAIVRAINQASKTFNWLVEQL